MANVKRLFRAAVRRANTGMRGLSDGLRACATGISYSQYGEDMVLRAIFARYPSDYRGFYVDVGAHHPSRYSNTRYFYDRGWSGVCVDPLPGCEQTFSRERPRDVFVSAGIASERGQLTYHMFDEPALNTFSTEAATEFQHRLVEKRSILALPLAEVLHLHAASRATIDFLSVDAEGMDLQVLMSNDWRRFRPLIVLTEDMEVHDLPVIVQRPVPSYMAQQGYRLLSKLPSALVFVDTTSSAFDGGSFLNPPKQST